MSKKQETGKREASHMNGEAAGRIVLVGTYKGDQLTGWRGWYNYPITDADKITKADAKRITELWLFKGKKDQRTYKAEFVSVKTRKELVSDYGYPATGKAHGDKYLLFKTEFKYQHKGSVPEDAKRVIIRTADFAKRSPKIAKQLKAYLESSDRKDPDLAKRLPAIITHLRPDQLRVCEAAYQMLFWELPQMRTVLTKENNERIINQEQKVCAPIAEYSRAAAAQLRDAAVNESDAPIRVIELFAGVGGFRIGLERASNRFETVWNDFAIAS